MTAKYSKVGSVQSLSNDLRTFATRISHDLKSHLNAIISANEGFKLAAGQGEPPDRMLISTVEHSVDEIRRLLDRVNFLLKATSGPQRFETVGISQVVAKALTRLESIIKNERARIIQPKTWPTVVGVDEWLEEIWWNLISNALKCGAKPPRIQLASDTRNRKHRFWVLDYGGGVEPNERGTLFQPFESLHGNLSSRGLGLTIVQRLVTLQGGECGYESLPHGSLFYFTLPQRATVGESAQGAGPGIEPEPVDGDQSHSSVPAKGRKRSHGPGRSRTGLQNSSAMGRIDGKRPEIQDVSMIEPRKRLTHGWIRMDANSEALANAKIV